jgi:hypothetical protein
MNAYENQQAMSQADLERLRSDLRVLSPAGIERLAWAWNIHEQSALRAYHDAERAALHAIEASGDSPTWDSLRRSLFHDLDGRGALVAWKIEHGQIGHKAERAAVGAALALLARPKLSPARYATLVRPMAEVSPWLLPEARPTPTG